MRKTSPKKSGVKAIEFLTSTAQPDYTLKSAYHFYGGEGALVSRCLKGLTELISRVTGAEAGSENYSGKEGFSSALDTANTYPMWGGKRFVVLQGVDLLDDEQQESLLSFLGELPDFTVMVLVSKSPDRRKKFYRALKDQALEVECALTSDKDWDAYLKWAAREFNLDLAPASIYFILTHWRESLHALEEELQRISLQLKAGTKLTPQVLSEIWEGSREEKIWHLTDFLAQKKTGAAIESLKNLLDEGEAEELLMAQLMKHYRLLSTIRRLSRNSHLSADAVASELGLNPYRAKILLGQCGRFSVAELDRINNFFLGLDLKRKSFHSASESSLELTVIKLCSPW